MRIRGQGGQPGVIDGRPDREVIEALKGIGANAKEFVKDVVEVATDTGRTDAGGFRLQVKHLTEHPGFPEKAPIPPRAPVTNRVAELSEHAEAESAVRGDRLVAAHLTRHFAEVRLDQAP